MLEYEDEPMVEEADEEAVISVTAERYHTQEPQTDRKRKREGKSQQVIRPSKSFTLRQINFTNLYLFAQASSTRASERIKSSRRS